MFATIWGEVTRVRYLMDSPVTLVFVVVLVVVEIWMLVDAIRRGEWIWAIFLAVFPGLSTLFYYFLVYRSQTAVGGIATRGFELPGAHSRRRIKELQAQIHHLDKPHHHLQLGDIYFQQGKLDLAESEYRAALERDSEDRDTRAHLGQCLLRKKRPAEAQPLLESVAQEDPKHDYGHTMMALAETYIAQGRPEAAIEAWHRVLQNYSYARARVQLAELLIASNQRDAAREQLTEVIESDAHAPAFDRKRNRVWIKRAQKLLKQI